MSLLTTSADLQWRQRLRCLSHPENTCTERVTHRGSLSSIGSAGRGEASTGSRDVGTARADPPLCSLDKLLLIVHCVRVRSGNCDGVRVRPRCMIRGRLALFLVCCCVGCTSAVSIGAQPSDSDTTPPTVSSAATDVPSGPSTPASSDWSWLDSFGDESTTPEVPAGWQVMDVGLVRFSVPQDWVATDEPCAYRQLAHGVVSLTFLIPELVCSDGTVPVSDNRLVISAANGEPPQISPGAHVGSFDAWQLPNSESADYRLTNGIVVAATGPDSALILASFTNSGAVRILQRGPLATTTDWKHVNIAGVSLLVPPTWNVQDLTNSLNQNPGECQREPWFWPEFPRAIIGDGDPGVTHSCGGFWWWPIAAVDGVWAHEIPDDAAHIGPAAAHGTTNGLDISIVERTLPDTSSIDPVVDVIVRVPGHVVRISIGVGPDATTARTILHSLHST